VARLDSRFGERDGNFVLSVAVVVSVGSTPRSRRSWARSATAAAGACRTAVLHPPVHRPDDLHRLEHFVLGVVLFIVANRLPGLADLRLDETVSRPESKRPAVRHQWRGIVFLTIFGLFC
jgi:hypothetical protein